MKAAGPIPRGALLPGDYDDLRQWFLADGHVATVHLVVEADVLVAQERLGIQWRNAATDLRNHGAPASVVDALGKRMTDREPRAGGTLVGFAAEARDPQVLHVPIELANDLASWCPLPRVGPVLGARQSRVPHVVVLTDRAGADVFAVNGSLDEHRTVQGDSYPIEKNAPGGWSQPRYQRRAETSWEENAAEVAAVVVEVADDIHAELIALAGDVRAVELVQESLPSRLASKVQVVPGSRHADGSEGARVEGVQRLVDTASAATTTDLLRKLREELGQHDRAVRGPGAVLDALAKGQVQVLLVHDDPHDARQAWFGPEPLQVGELCKDVQAMGVDDPSSDRLVDVAIRAAMGQGAGIRMIPRSTEHDDLGALLRWTA